ncbi:MAG: hypothetical protein OXG24_12870 [Gammaproteobacteria bacterium]|nr:hypothetical protein [Gammaproteobacteria bacterium]
MIVVFVLGVIGVLALLLLFKLLWNNKKTPINSKLVLIAVGVLAAVLLLASMRGMIHPFAAVGTLVLPFLRRIIGLLPWLTLFSRFGNPLGGAFSTNAFQQFGAANDDNSGSTASTNELSMSLDHGSGNIEGEVSKGPYVSRQLSSLSDSEIADLYHSLQEEESRRLLEAYIERHRPNMGQSEQASQKETGSQEGEMTTQRAADILGLDLNASRDEIIAAHRRLIQHLHPDQGGSSYLAAEINEARRILLDNL